MGPAGEGFGPLSHLHHSPGSAPALDVVQVRTGEEVHEAFLLWQKPGSTERDVRCLLDHVSEGVFELHLECGHELLLNEPFQDTEELLARAEELEKDTRTLPS